MLKFWMVWRYLQDGRKYLSLSFVMSVIGIALGVAALTVAMAVVSGYESTLRNSVINLHGHVIIRKNGGIDSKDISVGENKIRNALPQLKALTPFVTVEGLAVYQKKLSGVVLEGLDPQSVESVLSLSSIISAGELKFSEPNSIVSYAIIGKGLSTKFGLLVGDEFRLVIPISRASHIDGFKPKIKKFKVAGIIDLGRTDYDERYIITDLQSAQAFGELDSKIWGWRLKLSHYNQADGAVQRLDSVLEFPFWSRSWVSANRNLFQAVKYEKAVIFLVVFLMVIAAAFNVSSTLYLSVVRRYSQISILKALGVRDSFVRQLFTRQGLIVGFIGVFLGLLLGLIGCEIFLWAEKSLHLFPGEVYKLDHVDLELRWQDIALILASTLGVCYVSTLAPAKKGAQLLPIEGLRYE